MLGIGRPDRHALRCITPSDPRQNGSSALLRLLQRAPDALWRVGTWTCLHDGRRRREGSAFAQRGV